MRLFGSRVWRLLIVSSVTAFKRDDCLYYANQFCHDLDEEENHADFRIPELQSIAELHGFNLELPNEIDTTRPFMIIGLASEEHARALAKRCILIKSIYEFWAQGNTYEELHRATEAARPQWSTYAADTSFKFLVSAYNHTIPQTRQRKIMEDFGYMGFKGKIEMKEPEIILGCFEEYPIRHGVTRAKDQGDGNFRQVYFGRLIEDGTARLLITKFDVKKRAYFGNTSMEAEISLLMANQSLASSGKMIYDPFMGTGSMAYTTAHFGGYVFGSDIDGRQMRGKGKQPGITVAAKQYGVEDRIIDLCTFDVTNNPWRCGELFDAIITDPPYGVRAGAKRLGRKKAQTPEQYAAYLEHKNSPRPGDSPYIPPTQAYELSDLASDLVILSRYLLKPGGRLVFFLPTVNEEYSEVDIESMMCEGMETISNSLQDYGSWGRRLVTIRKATSDKFPEPAFKRLYEEDNDSKHVPAHKDFRDKYFQGFNKKESKSV